MWLRVPEGEVQHLFVVELHLETHRPMSDMLLPMAAFQLRVGRGSAVTHRTWIFNGYTLAMTIQVAPFPPALFIYCVPESNILNSKAYAVQMRVILHRDVIKK